MNQIIKRDGRRVPFDSNKIVDAILSAFKDVDGEISDYALNKANNIADFIADENAERELTIEEIQDYVEKGLMSTKRKDVAKSFILFRENRARERRANSKLIKDVGEKLAASNIQMQNANVDEASYGGRQGEAKSVLTKQYALDYCMSDLARMLHINNEVYTHDLDSFAVGMHNCLTLPIDKMMRDGVNTRQTDIRPANSINTFCQLVAVFFQLQSLQQFGGVSASHLDWSAVPYIRKSFNKHFTDGIKYCQRGQFEGVASGIDAHIPDNVTTTSIEAPIYKQQTKAYKYAMDMTIKETQQAVEGLYHNLNTLQSRSGNQLPFTSINYGTCTLPEGRMMIEALLQGSLKGVGKLHRTPIFPCGIFQLMKGVNREPGDPNYDLFKLALRSTATRLYPNYANVDWSGNVGYDRDDPKTYFSTMGCRTANGFDINGFGQLKDGRGNIAPVTIIMPTIAMEAKESFMSEYDDSIVELFLDMLDEKISQAKDILIERFEYICSQPAESAKFMYENGTMEGYIPEEGIRSALKHGTLAIGNLGLAETLQILIGKDHTTEEGMEVAKRIYKLFKDRCAEFKEKYKLNFGVYNTPAENLCHTAMKKFKERYGEIPNVSDKEFFTNSMHVPVWINMDPFTKIDIESQLTGYSSAGCITYVEFDCSMRNNLEALETVVNYAMDKDIPYFAINVPNDTCLDCGYCDEFNDVCPVCGSRHIQQLRRVTGYLTGNYTTAFNRGKQQEVQMRVKHELN